MSVTFNPLVRSESGHILNLADIENWHKEHARSVPNEIRLNHEGNPATVFGTSPNAYGYDESHYQTSEERNRARFTAPYREKARRISKESANNHWKLINKTNEGAWFSNEKTMKVIFIAAAVLAATGFALCSRGITKRKNKNKGRKTKRKFK
jgi:hypothetical protein